MTYTYRSNGATEHGAERDRHKLNRGLLVYRKGIASISARISALGSRTEREIAHAIWDDVPLRTVASAAGITVTKARDGGLAFEDLPSSGTSAESHVHTLRSLAQEAARLEAEQGELRRQREQLVVTTLETGLLGAPWVAAVSGLSLDRVNVLAPANAPERFRLEPEPGRAEVSAPGRPRQKATVLNPGDEKQ